MISTGQYCFVRREKDGAVFYAIGTRVVDGSKPGETLAILSVYNAGPAWVNKRGDGSFNRSQDEIKVISVVLAERPPFNVKDASAALTWYHASRTAQILNGQRPVPRNV